MNILVTGGGGFQGSHIVEKLLSQGHFVRVLNTPIARATKNLSSCIGNPNLSLVWGSVTDKEIVSKAARDCEVIIHLAAHINVDDSLVKPFETVNTNVMGTINVLDAAREQKARMIYASSCEVYGSASANPINETHVLNPHSPYAASKAAADRLVYSYYKSYDLDAIIVRPFNIFGPRQKSRPGGGVIPTFAEMIHRGQSPQIFGPGNQTRDYMYIDDLVQAYMLVLNTPSLKGQVVNFGTGVEVSVIEITEQLLLCMESRLKPVFLPPRPGEVQRFIADISNARALGFEPKVSFKEGIKRYVEWFLSKQHKES